MKVIPSGASARRTGTAVLAIALLTLAAFLPVLDADFLNFDDPLYVTNNPHVLEGLHAKGVRWALTSFDAANWHPLTWMSHMLDVSLFGLRPGPHHFVNLVLHTTSAILLLLLLHVMTATWWPSVLTALLFAVHPLRVESVAWVAERKDVLSVLLGMLTLLAYLHYVRRPEFRRYLLLLVALSLGLMAKPMLVTLPFVLLLLDWWPLGRFHSSILCTTNAWRLLREKAPLLILSAVSCAITYVAQQRGGAVASAEYFPLPVRTANALVSYVKYGEKLLWPRDLSPFYVHPGLTLSPAMAAIALTILAGITLSALAARRRHPWIITGWFWYLGILVPVIGVVQVGNQAMADRYSYLPLVGLFLAIAWEARARAPRRAWGRVLLGASAVVVSVTLAVLTWHQSSFWKDTATLFDRVVAIDPRNYMAYNMLGANLIERHEAARAIPLLHKALEIKPDNPEARYNLGLAFAASGQTDAAIEQFRINLRINPKDAEVLYNLGSALLRQGNAAEALRHLEAALSLHPGQPEIHFARGGALARLNRMAEAADEFRRVIELDGRNAEAHYRLGMTLAALGGLEEAARHYRSALEIRPGDARAHNNLGVTLAEQGRLDEALVHFEEALRLDPSHAEARTNRDNTLRVTRR